MAADLHIHAFPNNVPNAQAYMMCWFRSTLGSKYFSMAASNRCIADLRVRSRECHHGELIMKTDSIWIGEVSWLKASLFEDPGTFVPDTVQAVHEVIGEDLPVLTEDLRDEILQAFALDNSTSYSLADKEDVKKWLNDHMGQKLFTISW